MYDGLTAGWASIAAIIEERNLSKAEILLLQFIEKAQREDHWRKQKPSGP
ncbi:MAG TPA: hypothetical protein VHS31_11935 [Tepidisphaeraceae bacterium]|jgi:hypothetical protein|nr:hypothetical protein [Tepidisphaeraceae bacterium]